MSQVKETSQASAMDHTETAMAATMPAPHDGLEAFLLSRPLSRAVEETSELLKRWYVMERGMMRALAGWLPAVATQEIKLLMARHLWVDAVAADRLRERILQLRYPRRDVDRKWDETLVSLLQSATNAPDELCFISGVYRVLKSELLDAYQQAIARSEPVGDEPTIFLLNDLRQMKRLQLEEMLSLLEQAERRDRDGDERRERWTLYLQAQVEICGGVGARPATTGTLLTDKELERPFERPTKAQRDPRYQRHCELMTHHPLSWMADDAGLEWLSHAIAHFNELWATFT